MQSTTVATYNSPGDGTIVLGTQHLTEETQNLLQGRLKAFGLILTAGLVVSFLRGLVNEKISWQILYVHFYLLPIIGTGLAILFFRPSVSILVLRIIEASFMLSVFVIIVVVDTGVMIAAHHKGDSILIARSAHYMLSAFYAVLVIYGLFIPNHWKRTAIVTITVATLPIIVILGIGNAYTIWEETVPVALSLRSLTYLMLGVFVATYGSHVMYTLRQEAFEAKKIGQYQLEEKIGSGGMGDVWKAHHQMLARPAAIKLIQQDGENVSETALQRFVREAKITAQLKSPHTIEVYDFGITRNVTFYYVMELLKGMDLHTLIAKFGPVSPARAIHFLKQACLSLAEAHETELVHRDIKPANIFVCQMGISYDFVKVLDFGLVKATEAPEMDLTQEGAICGTPSFMAPETIIQRNLDPRSDVYALGCVAYWLVTGRFVFHREEVTDILVDHINTPPTPPSQVAKQPIPQSFEKIIMDSLIKSPANRPDILQLLQRLTRCEEKLEEKWNQEQAREWWQTIAPKDTATEKKTESCQ